MADKYIPMIGPDGSDAEVAASDVGEAIKRGARPKQMAVDTTGVANRPGMPQAPYQSSQMYQAQSGTPGSNSQLPVALGGKAKGMSGGVDTDPINRGLVSTWSSMAQAVPNSPGSAAMSILPPMYSGPIQTMMQGRDMAAAPPDKRAQVGVGQLAGQFGIDPQSVKDNASSGNYAGLGGDLMGAVLKTVGLGRVIGKTAGMGEAKVSPSAAEVGTNKMAASLGYEGNKVNVPESIQKSSAAISDVLSDPNTPTAGVADMHNVLKTANSMLESKFQSDLKPNAAKIVNNSGDMVSQKILQRITPDMMKTDPDLVSAYQDEAARFAGKDFTLQELENMRKRFGAGASSIYNKTDVAARADLNKATASKSAQYDAANIVREIQYNALEQFTGKDYTAQKQAQSALLDLQDLAEKRSTELANKAAVSKGTGRLTAALNPGSKAGLTQRALQVAFKEGTTAARVANRQAASGMKSMTPSFATDPLAYAVSIALQQKRKP